MTNECIASRPHLCFTEQDFQTIQELCQWAGQTESYDPLQYHSKLETSHILTLYSRKFTSFHMNSNGFTFTIFQTLDTCTTLWFSDCKASPEK